jgi:hypothetical protein
VLSDELTVRGQATASARVLDATQVSGLGHLRRATLHHFDLPPTI